MQALPLLCDVEGRQADLHSYSPDQDRDTFRKGRMTLLTAFTLDFFSIASASNWHKAKLAKLSSAAVTLAGYLIFMGRAMEEPGQDRPGATDR